MPLGGRFLQKNAKIQQQKRKSAKSAKDMLNPKISTAVKKVAQNCVYFHLSASGFTLEFKCNDSSSPLADLKKNIYDPLFWGPSEPSHCWIRQKIQTDILTQDITVKITSKDV